MKKRKIEKEEDETLVCIYIYIFRTWEISNNLQGDALRVYIPFCKLHCREKEISELSRIL